MLNKKYQMKTENCEASYDENNPHTGNKANKASSRT